ncbi:MAG: hypothetical protein JO253_03095 [Alphaproteobacteria bacterium]|nr:hypothetical protein [Alphaproteobacteria bacterium]
MTTDRELLELAAKAAGIEINYARQRERDESVYQGIGLWTNTQTTWNPLTDDGDALRLAVTMNADITIGKSVKVVLFSPILKEEDSICGKWVVQGRNDASAVRECIVRAAASIGEDMP